ncbi:2OG-Fe(II) oxygenase [Stutzerimonas kirkiae]|uniref:2OG-Fe(II) oxygenase n=1 Tax=Stutzerimonas kirkiae TaxID=2211392 RepID=A0A4Q9R800_9GAMM|nr:2OG-Fe(II) oxygenase [Stutzerimonas kirkiae]TBU96589.1 2OG-Fe(II) oxygenase [Stutzerimonas kirkiae]TBV02128.1 2OG-Fe(II) oxygenase [Stutzerimonas kirkiae]TBV08798.1 2OG-Fe(II) oxygenase [Stutzerimonas kirkiae]TBV15633.1 2OG-Fe(II) oxygenase [Stutzerimonas kirkiae]
MSFTPIIDELANRGFALHKDFLSEDMTHDLVLECRRREREGSLTPAGIGRGGAVAVKEGIRGDRIDWLEPGQSAASDRYLAIMDELRLALNQVFFLGLEEFECHFALYPPGAFYKTHLDRFRDDDSRTVTALLYLNHDWQPGHGGEMRMYLAQGALDVAPVAGSLVVFMSADIPHEVLPTATERLALTGWFRRRAVQPF